MTKPRELNESSPILELQNRVCSVEMSRSEREQDLEEKIRYQLHATGERDRLKTLLAAKLESSGWKDEIKARTKEFVEKQGKDTKDLSVDDIVKAVRPQGRCAAV